LGGEHGAALARRYLETGALPRRQGVLGTHRALRVKCGGLHGRAPWGDSAMKQVARRTPAFRSPSISRDLRPTVNGRTDGVVTQVVPGRHVAMGPLDYSGVAVT